MNYIYIIYILENWKNNGKNYSINAALEKFFKKIWEN